MWNPQKKIWNCFLFWDFTYHSNVLRVRSIAVHALRNQYCRAVKKCCWIILGPKRGENLDVQESGSKPGLGQQSRRNTRNEVQVQLSTRIFLNPGLGAKFLFAQGAWYIQISITQRIEKHDTGSGYF